ncbi:MAG: helix-turn-helix domain-containing protein [Candidatus Methanomethylicaceae archaeon]
MPRSNGQKQAILEDERPGIFWSYDALFDLPISTNAKIVYLNLCRRANKDRQAHPSYNRIGKDCSISRRAAIRAIDELLEFGLVKKDTVKEEDKNPVNIYTILDISNWCHTVTSSVQSGDSESPESGDCVAPEGIHSIRKSLIVPIANDIDSNYLSLQDGCQETSPDIIKRISFSKELTQSLEDKGLSPGQIFIISTVRKDLSIEEGERKWEWINKTKHFKNKQASFYTSLLENWKTPDSGRKKTRMRVKQ